MTEEDGLQRTQVSLYTSLIRNLHFSLSSSLVLYVFFFGYPLHKELAFIYTEGGSRGVNVRPNP